MSIDRLPNETELRRILTDEGVPAFRLDRLVKEFLDSWADQNVVREEDKLWSFQHGFTADKVSLYGMNQQNCEDYISDIAFFRRDSYKNLMHCRWFDDKLSTWYMLSPFRDRMPTHHFYLCKGLVHPLDTVQSKAKADHSDVMRLLREKGVLAAKVCFGGHGVGFHKLSIVDGQICVDGKIMEEKQFVEVFLPQLENYLITDFVEPTPDLVTITNGVTGVLRCITVFVEGEAHLASAIYKFGSHKGDVVTDYDGTIYLGVNPEDGSLFSPKIKSKSGAIEYLSSIDKHPETGVPLKGRIPNWSNSVQKLLEVSEYLQPTPFLTFDIIPRMNGIQIIEINSHGRPRTTQPHFPLFKNEWFRKLFADAYGYRLPEV
ncbi:MAG: hypothetical protein IKO68_01725 [Oscillospiraceae bacterium]|nr:hypothetical protein [Oscillospiraceae bacterium]